MNSLQFSYMRCYGLLSRCELDAAWSWSGNIYSTAASTVKQFFYWYERLMIVDEMDYVITRNEEVIQDLFQLCSYPNSCCILMGEMLLRQNMRLGLVMSMVHLLWKS